jgi:hypothetical protein
MPLGMAIAHTTWAQGLGPHFGLGYLGGDDVGLDDGYTQFGAFVPLLSPSGNMLFFSDTYLLLYNEQSDALGANLGGGARLYSSQLDRVFGGYAYYDFRDRELAEYHQIGFGFETLGRVVDGRVNVNLPTNTDNALVATNIFAAPEFGGPDGQNIVVGADHRRQAVSTLDLEAGALLLGGPQVQLKGYVGPYGLFGDRIDEWGTRGRIELRANDSAWIGGYIQNDALFGTTGGVTLEWRFGTSNRPSSYCSVAARMGDPVERRRHIAVLDTREDVLATDGGAAITVLHVDSNAAPGGSGGFQDPLALLADASNQPQDIVFAHGDSVFNGQSMVISTDGQQFLAEGTPHTITSDQGTFLLPGVNPGGTTPQIVGSPSAAVTLANGNTVSGFIINNSGSEAIFSDGSNAATILELLSIDTTGADAIRLENQTGNVTLDSVAVANAGGNGVRFVNGIANVTIQDSSIDTTVFDGLFLEDFSGTVDVADTTIDNAAGFAVSLANTTTTFNFTGGHIQNSTGAVGALGGTNTATFATDIDVSGNVFPIGNLYFNQADGSFDFTASTVNVTNGSGLVVTESGANFNFDDVTISGPTGRILLQENTGFFTFGDVDITSGSAVTSMTLADSNSATIDSLSINNTAGGALFIDNTDTVIDGGGITSTDGAAVSISDSIIDITFTFVTANSANSTPITLTNTTGNGFAITGNGVTPSSGGLLELESGGFPLATMAISLNTATNIDINFLNIDAANQDGVVAVNSTGLSFNQVAIENVKRGFDINESHNVSITNSSVTANNTFFRFGVSLESSVGSGSQGYDISGNTITGDTSLSGVSGLAGIVVTNNAGPDIDANIETNDITITSSSPPFPSGIFIFANGGDINLTGSAGAGDNSVTAPVDFTDIQAGGTINGQIFVNGSPEP